MVRVGAEILLRLVGVKPNSDAILVMISAWRLAIDTQGDQPVGDLTK